MKETNYNVIDLTVDNYFPVVDREADLNRLENGKQASSRRIMQLQNQLYQE